MYDPPDKHLRAQIDCCLRLSELSNCPRRKFGASLYDPKLKQPRGAAYNGGPRGGGRLCGGDVCLRDRPLIPWIGDERRSYRSDGREVARSAGPTIWTHFVNGRGWVGIPDEELSDNSISAARNWVDEHYPPDPIPSGTRTEIGCHHAEANALCNAAACGTPTAGLWLIVTGEPCLSCAKLIHHARITRVVLVAGGYAGGSAGVEYLEANGVEVQRVDGPQDPRGTINGA